MLKRNNMHICFTIDTDSDTYFGDVPERLTGKNKEILGWKNLEGGKHIIVKGLKYLEDTLEKKIPITWFVRADRQIGAINGDCGYLLHNNYHWWQKRLSLGDAVEWHAHLYFLDKHGVWQQEERDSEMANDLQCGLKAFHQAGLNPISIRIGESYHSASLMEELIRIGIRADCTALPGRFRQDSSKNIDWRGAPNRPFMPSINDPRVESPNGEIWEIPMNTVKTKVDYDKGALLRYINPAFNPGILDDGINAYVQNHKTLVTIMHPFEVMPEFNKGKKKHPLISFDISAMIVNLHMICSSLKKRNIDYKFITIPELISDLESGHE